MNIYQLEVKFHECSIKILNMQNQTLLRLEILFIIVFSFPNLNMSIQGEL